MTAIPARCVQVPAPQADLELATREVPDPGPGDVRLRVQACGICHSDVFALQGGASAYPRVPGHEIAGVIESLGPGVAPWTVGQRVGVGWYGGADGVCDACRRGDRINCANLRVPGLTDDGGYAEAAVFPADALAAIPEGISPTDAAPLMCAGVTTFNGLRRSAARGGDLVAVLGLGGLGHLGVQFAAKMGFEVLAIARGEDRRPVAKELGAHHYVDSTAEDPAEAMQRLGGAAAVLATVTSAAAMAPTVRGLRARGQLIVLGVDTEPLPVTPLDLVGASRTVVGHASGTSKDSEDTLRFAALSGVRPVVETMPLEHAAEGMARMLSGKARFRVVLTTGQT
jgi:D-arabinose 1-dehydrogenase-like Zn-dependent alcohol dehydrogenase